MGTFPSRHRPKLCIGIVKCSSHLSHLSDFRAETSPTKIRWNDSVRKYKCMSCGGSWCQPKCVMGAADPKNKCKTAFPTGRAMSWTRWPTFLTETERLLSRKWGGGIPHSLCFRGCLCDLKGKRAEGWARMGGSCLWLVTWACLIS